MYICTHRYSVNPILHGSMNTIKNYYELSNLAFMIFSIFSNCRTTEYLIFKVISNAR